MRNPAHNNSSESGKRISFSEEEKAEAKRKILSRRSIDPETGCWNVLKKDGKPSSYPSISIFGKGYRGNRASYAAYRGDLPPRLVVAHSCDNDSCVNPNHLEAKTQAENMHDKAARGRARNGTPGLPALCKKGSQAALPENLPLREDSKSAPNIGTGYGPVVGVAGAPSAFPVETGPRCPEPPGWSPQ